MKVNQKNLNIGKLYFCYLVGVLFLQIIGINGRSGTLDLVWKIGVIAGTILYAAWKSRWKISRYIALPCMIYILGQCAAIVFSVDGLIGTLINSMVVLGMTYLFMSVSHINVSFELKDILWFVKAFIALMLYAVAYSYITETDAVFSVLTNKNVYKNMISSFFDNKQTYGMFLFVAMIASVYGYALCKKTIYVIWGLLFSVNLFICCSRTALFAALAFVLLIIILLFKSNRKISLAILGILLCAVVVIVAVPRLRNFTFDVLFDTESTMNARNNIWTYAFQAMTGIKAVVGYGEANAEAAIASAVGARYNAHNGIIQVLLTGGVVKLLLYICVMGKSLASVLRIARHNRLLSSVLLAAIISVFVFSMGEALVLLDTSSPCVVASILCVAFPIAVDCYYQRQMQAQTGRSNIA